MVWHPLKLIESKYFQKKNNTRSFHKKWTGLLFCIMKKMYLQKRCILNIIYSNKQECMNRFKNEFGLRFLQD